MKRPITHYIYDDNTHSINNIINIANEHDIIIVYPANQLGMKTFRVITIEEFNTIKLSIIEIGDCYGLYADADADT